MARTQGHGNPDWTEDEIILALDLYFELRGEIPREGDERVQALSDLLRRYPCHSSASRDASFRNPAGVVFKLQNLRQVATGRGLANVSRRDHDVWAKLGNDPERTRCMASDIRVAIDSVGPLVPAADVEADFVEGRLLTLLHHRRERDPRIRRRLLETRRRSGILRCDMCNSTAALRRTELEDAIFEVHHILPLSSLGQHVTRTRLGDVVLLCANCHRVLHRAITASKRWIGLEEARGLVTSSQ